jgi:hypothetical protein
MDTKIGRRGALACMGLAGAGIAWTVTGGVPRMLGIGEASAAGGGLHFVQISDSHIGFDKDPNHDSAGTFKAAIDQIRAMNIRPSFLFHTGDITHLSKPDQFDLAAQIAGGQGSRSTLFLANMTGAGMTGRSISSGTARAQRDRAGTPSMKAASIS